MSRDSEKGGYSLKRRIQLLVLVFMIVVFLFLTLGVWVFEFYIYRERSHDATYETHFSLITLAREDTTEAEKDRARANLEELAERNPDLWYYYEDGQQSLTNGNGDPRFRDRVSGRVELDGTSEGQPRCSDSPSTFTLPPSEPVQLVRYQPCGDRPYYAEVGGAENPLPLISQIPNLARYRYVEDGRYQRNILPVAVLAATLLGLVAWLFGTLTTRIRDVSQAASNVGTGKQSVLLPEDDLPNEILPMVQAFNRAITRMTEASEQQALFVAAAAHELRTPLAVHRSRLEELPESELKEELAQDVRSMASMITQLLTLARLGSLEEHFEPLNLTEVVEDVCVERGRAVFEAEKELAFEDGAESVTVHGDRDAIKSAVANLIDNALLFTPDEGTVYVRVDGSRVTVKDEGPGVPDEHLEKIFEPFFKNPPNKRGHGLGLAIVTEIMRIHDGAVSVSNVADGGAEFTLSFPPASP